MATITLQVGPDAAHVRIVRLVAAAIARRAGVSEESVDEVRLAVGEACGLAVSAQGPGRSDALSVQFEDTLGLRVVVRAPVDLEQVAASDCGEDLAPGGLDVIRALLDDVSISTEPGGSVVAMRWPALLDHPSL